VSIGLVQELDLHPYDCAAKYLSVPGTYVLVKKQPTSSGPENEDETVDISYDYVPLLNNYQQILPGYRVQRTAAGMGEAARRKPGKTLSPAAAAKPSARSKQAKDRAPSRKR